MNILLSNDDGYQAEGIKVLEEVLLAAGHDVYVSAPESQQSGKSHSLTIHGEVVMTEYAPKHFHVTGSPADCIIYSHRSSLFPVQFDVVISGINHGYNLSTDTIYSGTCAAARQAALYGIKAIAISNQYSGGTELYRKSALFLAEHLESFMSVIPAESFMNINIPESFDGSYVPSGIGGIEYNDGVVEKRREGNRIVLEIAFSALEHIPSNTKYPADFEACNAGKAAVSIIDVHPGLSRSAMEALGGLG